MDKRALSALPRPKVKKQYQELRQMISGMKGIVTAERIEIGGEDTLVINCFKPKGKTVIPWFRTFCQETEYISQDLTEKKTRWRTAAFDYIAGFYISDTRRMKSNLVLASSQDGDIIIEFMREWRERNHTNRCDAGFEFEDYIYAYQADIRDRKLAEKHRKICEKIDTRMELFGELPEDYQRFIEKKVFDDYNYFFYLKKEKWAYCTRCGHEYELRKDGIYHRKIAIWNHSVYLRHNKDYICPHCNKPIVAKSEGYGRGGLLEVNWSVLVQPSGDNVLVRYFCHSKDFSEDFRHPKIKSREMLRTIHTPTAVENYEWETYTYSQEVRWCYPRRHVWGWNPSEFQVPRSTVLYNTNFDFLNTTCMKYSCIGMFLEGVLPTLNHKSPYIVDNYLNFYHRYSFVEQMIKIGWYRLVGELFETYGAAEREGFKNGRNILETCGITRSQFKLLREATNGNPELRDLRIIKHAEQKEIRLTVDDLNILRFTNDEGCYDFFDKFLDAMRYTTLYKLDKYLNNQKIKHKQDYFDYAGWLMEMGYDMRNEFNIYPRNFVEKHDEMAKAYQKFKDKQHREDIKKFNRLLKQMRKELKEDNPLNLQVKGLFIRLPYRADELKTEGETLHHCVGTYIDRVMRGKTAIFFVRRIESPDEPFYTLEWKDHKVVQCRGAHNCDMTPEVKAFTALFEEQMRIYELKGGAVSA